jgi:hypothetical protein
MDTLEPVIMHVFEGCDVLGLKAAFERRLSEVRRFEKLFRTKQGWTQEDEQALAVLKATARRVDRTFKGFKEVHLKFSSELKKREDIILARARQEEEEMHRLKGDMIQLISDYDKLIFKVARAIKLD